MSEERIKTVKEIYIALNRNDLSTYLSFFHPDVDRFESFGGRYRGVEELRANFSQGRDKWAEGSCAPGEFTIVGNKVIVFVHVRVRLKDRSDWIEGDVTDIFTFRDKRVVEFYSFDRRDEGLRWASGTEGKR